MGVLDGPEKVVTEGPKHPLRTIVILALCGAGIYASTYIAEVAKRDSIPKPPPTVEAPQLRPKPIACTDPEQMRAKAPLNFDFGWADRSPTYLHINDDGFCDYCRFVGNSAETFRCTLGTENGLTGQTVEKSLSGGTPYPGTASWIDFDGKGTPALRGIVGNDHERQSTTPVRVVDGTLTIGETDVRLKSQ